MGGSLLEGETVGQEEVMCWVELGGETAQLLGEGLTIKKYRHQSCDSQKVTRTIHDIVHAVHSCTKLSFTRITNTIRVSWDDKLDC